MTIRNKILMIADIVLAILCTLLLTGYMNKPEEIGYTGAYESHPVIIDITNAEPMEELIVDLSDIPSYTNLGEFKITYYCACTKCCGPNAKGITASGKHVEVGMCAADKQFKFGTVLYINEDGVMTPYVVEDRGGAIKGNRIDIYVEDHDVCNQLGVLYTDVFILND